MGEVVYFEIQADDPERAMAFYRAAFGWRFEQWGSQDYWMITTADNDSNDSGINGGLLPRPAKTPPQAHGTNAYVCTVQVDDFDAVASKIAAAGGIVALPKFAMPKVAWQGYFIDPEGNTFGVRQPDEHAE